MQKNIFVFVILVIPIFYSLKNTNSVPSKSSFDIIYNLYAKVSAATGPTCVFRPTCSSYSKKSIKKYGILKGLVMTGDRLIRCNPTAYGFYKMRGEHNYDPPEKHSF